MGVGPGSVRYDGHRRLRVPSQGGDGSVRVEHDRHEVGLFPRAVWIETLEEAGFTDVERILFEHSEVQWGLELFLGRARQT